MIVWSVGFCSAKNFDGRPTTTMAPSVEIGVGIWRSFWKAPSARAAYCADVTQLSDKPDSLSLDPWLTAVSPKKKLRPSTLTVSRAAASRALGSLS
jgi:hypothetical protein